MNERRLAMADPAFTLGVTNQGVRPGRPRLLARVVLARRFGSELPVANLSAVGRPICCARLNDDGGDAYVSSRYPTPSPDSCKAASAPRRVDLGE